RDGSAAARDRGCARTHSRETVVDVMANESATREYAKPPEEVDMARGERGMRVASLIAFVVLAAAVAAGRLLLPGVWSVPTRLDERLAFAAQSAVFVMVWVLVGVFLVSTGRRFSPADSG